LEAAAQMMFLVAVLGCQLIVGWIIFLETCLGCKAYEG
jgi:hypothetical protein